MAVRPSRQGLTRDATDRDKEKEKKKKKDRLTGLMATGRADIYIHS